MASAAPHPRAGSGCERLNQWYHQCRPTAPPDGATVPAGPPAAAAAAKTIRVLVTQTLPIPASALDLSSFAASAAQQACNALNSVIVGTDPSCTATTVVLPQPPSGGRRLQQGGSATLLSTIKVRVVDALAAAGLSADKVQQVGAAVSAAVGEPVALQGILRSALGGSSSSSGIDLALVAQQAVTTASASMEGGGGASPGTSPGPGTSPSHGTSPGPGTSPTRGPPPESYDVDGDAYEDEGDGDVDEACTLTDCDRRCCTSRCRPHQQCSCR
jgi:hypothetical protein